MTIRKKTSMKKIYYGWIVCGLCTMIIFVTMGAVANGFSFFLPYIKEAGGFTSAQTSFLITIRCLSGFIAMMGIGHYYEHFSVRKGLSIAVACVGAAFCIYGLAGNYFIYGLGSAVAGFGYGMGSMVPVSILMTRWFMKHRALAVSICAAGSSLATIILSPATTLMVEHLSLRAAFWVQGALFLLVALAAAVFLRNEPREMGMKPYGHESFHAEIIASGGAKAHAESFTLSPKGWMLMGGVALSMGAFANPSFSHLSILFITEGFEPMTVAAVISAVGASLTVSKILFGESADKLGGRKTSILFIFVLLIGHVMCCFAYLKSIILCVITAVFIGIGFPVSTVGNSVWASDMASPDHYPDVVRRLQVIYSGGALLFASVPGMMADHFGSYIPAYMLFSVLLVFNLILIMWAYKESVTERKKVNG